MAIKLRKSIVILFMPVLAVGIIALVYLASGVRSDRKTNQISPENKISPEQQVEGDLPPDQELKPDQDRQDKEIEIEIGQGTDDGFFVSCSGMPMWELAAEISSCFDVNILVFDDIKDKKVYGDIKGVGLKQVLDAVSWYIGCEYVQKDNIYYMGSNTKTILILPSAGMEKQIEGVFKDVTMRVINDKVIVYGTERDVARVKAVYDDLTKQRFCLVRLYAIEVAYEKNVEFGVDIEQSVKYAFSWENIISNSYNPVQALSMSLYASLQLDSDQLRVSSLIDTDLGLLSGVPVTVQVGEDQDRPVYSQSEYGDRVVSGYNTQKTGLLLELKGSFDRNEWVVDFNVENSESKSDLIKTLTSLTTKARISKEIPVHLLCKLNMASVKESYEKGIPFLADIPFLGYLFRASRDREMRRQIFFILAFRNEFDSYMPVLQEPSMLIRAGNGLQSLDKLFQSIDKPLQKK